MTNRTSAPPQPFDELEAVADELRADVDRAEHVGADDMLPARGGAA